VTVSVCKCEEVSLSMLEAAHSHSIAFLTRINR
jgi:hypothetical protein